MRKIALAVAPEREGIRSKRRPRGGGRSALAIANRISGLAKTPTGRSSRAIACRPPKKKPQSIGKGFARLRFFVFAKPGSATRSGPRCSPHRPTATHTRKKRKIRKPRSQGGWVWSVPPGQEVRDQELQPVPSTPPPSPAHFVRRRRRSLQHGHLVSSASVRLPHAWRRSAALVPGARAPPVAPRRRTWRRASRHAVRPGFARRR